MTRSIAALSLSFVLAVSTTLAPAATVKTTDITKDKLGSPVEVEGKVSSFRASKGEKSPNSFMLKDAAGEVRVVIWPKEYADIKGKEGLGKDGTQVKVEGEVAEYKDKIEVHVKNGSGVTVSGGGAAAATAASDKATSGSTH
jgi:DNA/RNA endonuclease YhcR with UshA esterase domain